MRRLDATCTDGTSLLASGSVRAAVTLLLIALLSASSHAVTTNWNVGSGIFNASGSWENGVPGADDVAVFRRGNVPAYSVLFGNLLAPISPTINRLVVGTNTLTFNVTNSSLTVEEFGRGGVGGPIGGDMIIGQTASDVAVLTSNLTNLSAHDATLGSAAGSSGTLNLTMGTAKFNVTGIEETYDLAVGSSGTGTINVSGGADVTVAGDTALGLYSGSTGIVNVAGAGSTWTSSGYMHVGEYGSGALSVSAGGQISNTDGYVGTYAESTGEVVVLSGGNWTLSGDLYVGNLGDGRLTISDGVVRNDTGYIGYAAGSVGHVSVDFGSWNNSAGLYVGHEGTGTLEISPTGTTSTANTSYIGYAAGSSGSVTIDDGRWLNKSVTVGYQGNGSLDVENGGFIRSNFSNTNVTIGSQPGSDGAVHLTGVNASGDHSMWRLLSGSFYVGYQSTGSLDIAAGGQLINEAGYAGPHVFEISSAAGSEGAVTVRGAGSLLSGFGQLTVGRAGPGTLNISAGAVVDSGSGYIGHDSGVTGVVTIDGTGSLWESPGDFHVGYAGDGTLRITNGGRVRNYGDRASVGQGINSTGAVTVDGVGSKWSLDVGLEVGYAGTGTLDITSGGVVESGATTIIGDSAFGVGTVNVNGIGSYFEVITRGIYPGQLYIGRRGSGTLNITQGALATILVAGIGGSELTSDTGDGAVTVDGAGSRLEVPGHLFVGNRGEGTLTVTNGAYLQAGDTVIGDNSGAIGTLTIDGPGSQALFDFGMLTIGEQGEGTFKILNGAQVTTTTQVRIGAAATLPAGNGTLSVDGPGSSLQVSSIIHVGYRGQGTLDVRNGAHVNSQFGQIGNLNPQTRGTVTVDGPGSSWANTSTLSIQGNAGAATLLVTGGGSVSNTQGFIGNNIGTNGEATVDGMGSQWINSGNLSVGNVGNGLLSVTNGGTVQTPNLIIGVNGQLQGDGNIVGNVQNAGLVSPGTSPGALRIDGDYTQTATGQLVIGLASTTSHDQLLVTGDVSLAGTLRVPIEGFFAVSVNDAFDILDFTNLSGTFSTIELPVLPGLLEWDTSQLYTNGILSVGSPGDYNQNGTVDAADYVVWRKTDGTQSGYDAWRTNLGRMTGAGAVVTGSANAVVPEATSWLMLILGMLAIFFRRRTAVS